MHVEHRLIPSDEESGLALVTSTNLKLYSYLIQILHSISNTLLFAMQLAVETT